MLQRLCIANIKLNVDDLIVALAESPKLFHLRHLTIDTAEDYQRDLKPLTQSVHLHSLETLGGIRQKEVKPFLEGINAARQKGIRALPDLQFIDIDTGNSSQRCVSLVKLAKEHGIEMAPVPPEPAAVEKKHSRVGPRSAKGGPAERGGDGGLGAG